MNRALALAIVCGALPLLAGFAVFGAWVSTRADWLMPAGMWVMGGGVVLFLIGLWSLMRYFRSRSAAARAGEGAGPNIAAVLLVGGLLIANFPVAGCIVGLTIMIETSYTVEVRNQTGHRLTDVRLEGGGFVETIEIIGADGTASNTFWVKSDGQLELTARDGDGNETHRQVIVDYVTHNGGGHVTVTLEPNGEMKVVERGRSTATP